MFDRGLISVDDYSLLIANGGVPDTITRSSIRSDACLCRRARMNGRIRSSCNTTARRFSRGEEAEIISALPAIAEEIEVQPFQLDRDVAAQL
jgi:hypothetical protein